MEKARMLGMEAAVAGGVLQAALRLDLPSVGNSGLSSSCRRHDRQRHCVKHILVKSLLPLPILGQVDLEFRELGYDDRGHFLLGRPAVAAGELLDRARGVADEFEPFLSGDGADFIEEHVQERGVPVPG